MAPQPGHSGLRTYSRLLAYVMPYWGAFLLSIVGFLIYSLFNVSFVQLISYIVDSLKAGGVAQDTSFTRHLAEIFGQPGDLNRIIIPLAIVLIAAGRGLGAFVGNYFIAYVSTNLVHNLRCELFDRLLTLPGTFYDRHAMGHLVAKITFHVTQVTGAATDALRIILREGFTVIGYLGFLLYLNWKLTLIFFAVAPVIALLVRYAGRRFRRISARIQDSMGDVTHVASEAVQGYREVRTFGGGEYESQRFHRISRDNLRQSMKMVVTAAVATPVIQVMVAFALAGLVWLVLDPVLLVDMTPGSVVAFITAGGLLAKPIRQLSAVNATVQKGLAAAEDIFELFDEESEKDTGELEIDQVAGRVEFRDVHFGYGPGLLRVFNGISFTVSQGETIALVGRSGSGKSTLVSLIPRFYSPDSGEILLDGHPIESFSLANLREHIAIVSQQVTLFNDTVARNIAYGALRGSSREDIREAAEKAYAWEFIDTLEDGLDTLVGDDGVLLSGGQRQRLAIARAFLKDAPILILDEATSALDTESERYIQAALEAVVQGRTTFIIAHRLSTIENADRILVIDKGEIVEQGSHSELLARRGFYAQLHARDEITGNPEDEPAPVPAPTPGRGYPMQKHTHSLLDSSRLVDAWYTHADWVRWLAPLAYLYRLLVGWRRKWLAGRSGWKSETPLIVVGNIAVGGTGKSPLVIGLVTYLRSLGLKPGVVSRGYGGRSVAYPVEVCAASTATEVGDEPLMIYRRTQGPVMVDPDRVRAVKSLLQHHDCDVIVSDDGLQHYALGRDLEIAVVDGERGLGNGLCLPAGPLREPPSRLREVDLIFINGRGIALPEAGQVPVCAMRLKPTRLINLLTGDASNPACMSGKTVHGVAGISNPGRFMNTLGELGCSVIPHQFPDHHAFTVKELAFDDDLPVIMTEKDAVKFDVHSLAAEDSRYWYLEVDAEFDKEYLDARLQSIGLPVEKTGDL